MIQKKRNWEHMESGGNDEKFLPMGLALTGIAVEGYATATPKPKGEDGRWRNPHSKQDPWEKETSFLPFIPIAFFPPKK